MQSLLLLHVDFQLGFRPHKGLALLFLVLACLGSPLHKPVNPLLHPSVHRILFILRSRSRVAVGSVIQQMFGVKEDSPRAQRAERSSSVVRSEVFWSTTHAYRGRKFSSIIAVH